MGLTVNDFSLICYEVGTKSILESLMTRSCLEFRRRCQQGPLKDQVRHQSTMHQKKQEPSTKSIYNSVQSEHGALEQLIPAPDSYAFPAMTAHQNQWPSPVPQSSVPFLPQGHQSSSHPNSRPLFPIPPPFSAQ
jgi:hypothetical protein